MAQGASLKAAVQGAYLNVILRVLLRILTFVLNAVVLRFISRDALGLVNVRYVYAIFFFLNNVRC